MGYELHITRKKFHFDELGEQISPAEWHDYVDSDPELTLNPQAGEHFVNWSGENRYGAGNAWFDWFEGNIETKHPDENILAKMLSIAKALGAKVQGDDGEVYVKANLEEGFIFEDSDG